MRDRPTKLQLLAWAPPGTTHDQFASRVHREIVPGLCAAGPKRLTLHVTEEPPPRLALIPFSRRPVALVSVQIDGPLELGFWREQLLPLGGQLAAYRVTESTPVSCPRKWPAGAPTPGVGLLALLRRHPLLPYEEFMHEWHNRHTPMSMGIHPLKHYERNVVQEVFEPTSPLYDGIVTEHFDPPGDLLNPVRLFGGPWRMLGSMIRVGLHIRRFLDMPKLENYLVTEYRIVDGGAGAG